MKLTGYCRLFQIENKGKFAQGKIYFFHNVAKKGEEAKYETDYINCRLVGQAKSKIDSFTFDINKLPIDVTESLLRNRNYTNANGESRTWLELTIFDFELQPQPQAQAQVTQTAYQGYQR